MGSQSLHAVTENLRLPSVRAEGIEIRISGFPDHTGVSNLDLAPDGKRFAVLASPVYAGPEQGSAHVTFMLNFFDELLRLMPPSN